MFNKAIAKTEQPPATDQAVITQQDGLLNSIEKLLASPDTDLDRIDKYLDIQERILNKRAESDFVAAMVKFNSIKKNIKHNRTGTTAGNARFSYSDFPTTVATVTPWMNQCGLSFVHKQDPPTVKDGQLQFTIMHCIISHESGHSETFDYPVVTDERLRGKVSPSQLLQLAGTYAKRQTLCMGLGLATSDDKYDDDGAATVEVITESQAADIESLITETQTVKAQFLKFFKIDGISGLPAIDFKRAINMLEIKKKKI